MRFANFSYLSISDNGTVGYTREAVAMKPNAKFAKVMREFGAGKLKSSSGKKVKDVKQAVAIAYSEKRALMKMHRSNAHKRYSK
jgi:hypothetical protein